MPFYEDYINDFTMDFYKDRAAGGNAGMHIHPQYELLVVLENTRSKTTINGQPYHLNQPFAALFAPFALHHTSFLDSVVVTRHIYYFDDSMIKNHPEEFKEFQTYCHSASVIFALPEDFAQNFRGLQDEALKNRNNVPVAKLLFLLMLQLLLTDPSVKLYLQTKSEIGQTNQIVRYMIDHFADDLTAEEVAQKFFISRSKLYRDFQDYTTVSFRQFLIELRISKAKFLLQKGLSCRQAAAEVGFENESYFCQCFKKSVGITPLQFAKQVPKIRSKSDTDLQNRSLLNRKILTLPIK